MVLNYIWIALFVIGLIVGLINQIIMGQADTLPSMMDSTFEMSKSAFEMALGLTGTLTLWMGIMKIGEDSGMVRKLARFLSPVLTKLFPEVPKDHPALSSIFMNVSANMLGLDNAATPMGLKAMQELQELNKEKETATNAMIMFLVLNTSGLTIIPISIMAYRQQMGAADPTDVFIPLLLTTMCSTFVGLLTVSIRQKINLLQNAFLVMFSVILALVAALFWSIYGMDKGEMETFCRVLTSVLLLGAIILFISYGWRKKINVYDSFIQGAKGGFNVAVSLIPYYLAILVAIGVFKTSGAMTLFQEGLTWCVDSLGFNTEFVSAIPVALMKPLDGGAARGMMLDCMQTYGPDSFVGHVSSVMQGSTDTTLKILAIYFGSVGIKKYRYAVGCGLLADLAGIIAAILISYFFFF